MSRERIVSLFSCPSLSSSGCPKPSSLSSSLFCLMSLPLPSLSCPFPLVPWDLASVLLLLSVPLPSLSFPFPRVPSFVRVPQANFPLFPLLSDVRPSHLGPFPFLLSPLSSLSCPFPLVPRDLASVLLLMPLPLASMSFLSFPLIPSQFPSLSYFV
jgi:hypothetical protein